METNYIENNFEFRGSTSEYYKIWIVNLLLTIITLGIFSAWAKVRSKRYFYANTFLDNANFEYHANPLSILVARVIVIAIILGGTLWAGEDLVRNAAYSLLIFALLPWALVRGLAFNARYSSYRNVRFSFRKNYAVYMHAYLIYLPLILLFPAQYFISYSVENPDSAQDVDTSLLAVMILYLSLMFITPWITRAYHGFKAQNHRWGKIPAAFNKPPISRYLTIFWLFPLLITLVSFTVAFIISFIIGVVSVLVLPESYESYESYLPAYTVAGLLAVMLFQVMRAMVFRLYWGSLAFAGGGKIICRFTAMRFGVGILFVNLLIIILSLGLLYPWTQVRKMRFLTQNTVLQAPAEFMDNVQAGGGEGEGALGEEYEMIEGFDFDVGLI